MSFGEPEGTARIDSSSRNEGSAMIAAMQRWIVLAGCALALAAAGPCGERDDALTGEGTIQRGVGPECPNTWHVATADGQMLWPVEDPALQQEGLRVRYSARPVPDRVSICMAGTIVEFVSLRRL
jgi:hypothetical protein